jgi:hypothetical protein
VATPARVRLAAEILASYVRVRWLMARLDLPEAVARLRAGDRNGVGSVNPFHMAGATARVLSLLPTDSRCLMRSLVLVRMLAVRGVASTLVIGVRTDPDFAAHAWVEWEGAGLLPTGSGEYRRLTEI